MKWRYDNINDLFAVDIQEFITDRSILIGNITEAVYMVKVNKADADASALVTLTIGSGITKVPASGTEPDRLALQFSSTDFVTGKLEVLPIESPALYVGLGIKTSSMTQFLEAELIDDRLIIVDDFIHD